MASKIETYYLIKDKGRIYNKVFDTPEDLITYLNYCITARTGVDTRVRNGEIEILAVEAVRSVYPIVNAIIELPFGAFV